MSNSNNILLPIFSDNYVTISANSSNEYVPYLSVYLESIKSFASNDTNYDVVILEQSITNENKAILKEFFETKPNLSLRFYNPSQLFENSDLTVSHYYLCKESYFRLGAPIIFKNYKKLIFTDLDLIFNYDPKALYDEETNNAPICAVLEPVWSSWINRNATVTGVNIIDYSKNVLKLKDLHQYFNTGVMLMDVDKLNKNNYAEAFLKKLSNGTNYLYQDQDVINEVLESKLGVLPWKWNNEIFGNHVMKIANKEFLTYCTFNEKNIIHWIGPLKPWVKPDVELANYWWKYARKTPYYEIILTKMINEQQTKLISEALKNSEEKTIAIMNDNVNVKLNTITSDIISAVHTSNQEIMSDLSLALSYRKNILTYWRYKILSNITFGKKKENYKNKRLILKEKIKKGKILRGI